MELVKKNIHMEHHCNLASVQISLEEDQNISDQKPDAFRIICKKADVKVEDVKVQEDTVWVKGKLIYDVLYLTDEKEKRICCINGELMFDEKIYVNKPVVSDNVRIRACVEDMMIRLINSRKLNIRSVVAVTITLDKLYNEEVVVDVEQPECCEILKKPLDVTTIVLDTKDIYRIKEEMAVPDGFPNIYNMIWKNVQVSGVTFVPMDGRIGVQGEWKAFFLYEGEEEETDARFFEVARPFSGVLEIPECHENMHLCVDYESEQPQIEIRCDYDGEERLLGLELELKLYIKIYRNMVLPIVADAYGLQEALEPVMKESTCEQILKKENGKIKISDTWEDKENQEENLQVMTVSGLLVDEKVVVEDGELSLMGVLHMDILCKTGNDDEPYRCVTVDMPYKQTISEQEVRKDCPYYAKVYIEQVNANVQGTHIDVRAMLCYDLMIYKKIMEPLLTGMQKRVDEDPDKVLPGMAVCFAKEGESIWDIGKKYRVSLNSIRGTNQLNSDVLSGGQRILVAKEMTK